MQEVDWDAVGHSHGEQNGLCYRHVAIMTLELYPTLARGVELDSGLMHLIPQHGRSEAGLRPPERPPPGHYVVHRGIGPEAKIEAPALLASPPGDSGNDPESLPPIRDGKPRNGAFDRFFSPNSVFGTRYSVFLIQIAQF